MAYGTTSNYGDDVGIARIYRAGFVDAIWRNNSFLGLTVNGQAVFPRLPAGDSSYRWRVAKTGNTSAAVFTEGGAAPTAVAHTYGNAVVGYTYAWAWTRISGQVRDVLANRPADAIDLMDGEMTGGFADVADVLNVGFMGSSYAGVEAAVSSTTTYGGISRGSAGYWEATATNHNGALTRTGLLDVQEACEDNDKGGKTSLIVTARNQVTNYVQLTGAPNAANSSIRVELGLVGGKSLDLAPRVDSLGFMGAPIVGMPDWTNEVWVGLDLRPVNGLPNWGLSIRREFDVRGPQMSADDDLYEMSCAMALICHQPKWNWKLYDVTA